MLKHTSLHAIVKVVNIGFVWTSALAIIEQKPCLLVPVSCDAWYVFFANGLCKMASQRVY